MSYCEDCGGSSQTVQCADCARKEAAYAAITALLHREHRGLVTHVTIADSLQHAIDQRAEVSAIAEMTMDRALRVLQERSR